MSVPDIALNDGHRIPQVGFGTWPLDDQQVRSALATALSTGYRHVDTAAAYGNERGVGAGIRDSGVPRQDVFLTTKINNSDHGRRQAVEALDASLRRLGTDYVDLALIHWPMPGQDLYLQTWEALIALREAGKARSIGVSNFRPAQLDRLIHATGVTPAVNQIEVNPIVAHTELRQAVTERGITVVSWSPLGKDLLDDAGVEKVAAKHDRSAAQVILRWHVQLGLVVFPKSVTPARIKENAEIFDFELSAEEMAQIGKLDAGTRLGPDPSTLRI